MKPPLFGRVEGGVVYVEGAPLDVTPGAYPRSLRARTVYLVGAVRWQELEGYMGPGAEMLRTGGGPMGLHLRTKGAGLLRLLPADAWGLPDEEEEARERFGEVRACIEARGWRMKLSAAGVMWTLIRDMATEPMTQLVPRFRRLAHDAIHPGPCIMTATCGAGEHVVELDREAAFLRGLGAEMPAARTWAPVGPWDRWDEIRRHPGTGLIRARVRIPHTRIPRHIPPLGVTVPGGAVYPTGTAVGTWTLGTLRTAEELGVHVLEILEGALALGRRVHAPLADALWDLREEDRALSRTLYTRGWGVMASLGRWVGTTGEGERVAADGTVRQAGAPRGWESGLWWTWGGHGGTSHRCPAVYRPDHAAHVAANNAQAMARVCHDLRGSVVAAHVDAVWTTDTEGAAAWAQGPWQVKAAGPGRWWAPGVAEHAGRLLAQGYDEERMGPLTPSALRAYGAACGPQPGRRWWPHGTPRRGLPVGLESLPPRWRSAPTQRPLTVWNTGWSARGWWHDELATVPRADAGQPMKCRADLGYQKPHDERHETMLTDGEPS